MEYKELVLLNLDDFEEEGQEREKAEFIIDTPQKCEWAIEKVKDEQKRYELFEEAIKSKIELLKEQLKEEKQKMENKTSWLKWKLNDYLDSDGVPAKKTKTSMSLKMPSGQIVRKMPKLEYIPITPGCKKINEDETLIKYCKDKLPEAINTIESVKWNELKKTLKITQEEVVDIETGKVEEKEVVVDDKGNILPIGIESTPMKIEIK